MVDRGNKGAAILGGISRSVNVERVARAPSPAVRGGHSCPPKFTKPPRKSFQSDLKRRGQAPGAVWRQTRSPGRLIRRVPQVSRFSRPGRLTGWVEPGRYLINGLRRAVLGRARLPAVPSGAATDSGFSR